MNKRILWAAIAVNALALAGLLVYSLERSIWLFSLYEEWSTPAIAAAAVIEVAAVALIISAGALELLDPAARAWSNRALGAILSVQALANLTAGYLRGGRQALALFGPDDLAAYSVGAVLWLVTNLAVPVLVLSLSKLLERLIAAAALASSAPAATWPAATPSYTYSRPAAPADVPIYVEQAAQSERSSTQSGQSPAAERPEPARDRTCKYCGAGGLSAIEVARHGRARARSGACAK
jgi:hypothetical protein